MCFFFFRCIFFFFDDYHTRLCLTINCCCCVAVEHRAKAFTYSLTPGPEAAQVRRYGIFAGLILAALTYTILAAWMKRRKSQAAADGE